MEEIEIVAVEALNIELKANVFVSGITLLVISFCNFYTLPDLSTQLFHVFISKSNTKTEHFSATPPSNQNISPL